MIFTTKQWLAESPCSFFTYGVSAFLFMKASFKEVVSTLVFTLTALTLLPGCEKTDLGTIDDTELPPQIHQVNLVPALVNIDSLPSSAGTSTITTTVVATVSNPAGLGGLSSVNVDFFRPLASSPLLRTSLMDNGVSPDSVAHDGIFSGSFAFQATRAQAGSYRVGISAVNDNGQRSGTLTTTMLVTRNNSAPYLDSLSLQAPDTLTRPSVGSTLFMITIAASDSDGLADIRQVFLQNLASSNRDFLLDDGGIGQPNGISSGDELAGDGIFSIVFQLPSTVPPGEYHYILQASDSFADTSRSIPYTLVIQ